MIKSLHIGRYIATPAQFQKVAAFLEAIGMEQVPGAQQRSALFAAPQGLISFNQPKASHPLHLRERLKETSAKVLVLEVRTPTTFWRWQER